MNSASISSDNKLGQAESRSEIQPKDHEPKDPSETAELVDSIIQSIGITTKAACRLKRCERPDFNKFVCNASKGWTPNPSKQLSKNRFATLHKQTWLAAFRNLPVEAARDSVIAYSIGSYVAEYTESLLRYRLPTPLIALLVRKFTSKELASLLQDFPKLSHSDLHQLADTDDPRSRAAFFRQSIGKMRQNNLGFSVGQIVRLSAAKNPSEAMRIAFLSVRFLKLSAAVATALARGGNRQVAFKNAYILCKERKEGRNTFSDNQIFKLSRSPNFELALKLDKELGVLNFPKALSTAIATNSRPEEAAMNAKHGLRLGCSHGQAAKLGIAASARFSRINCMQIFSGLLPLRNEPLSVATIVRIATRPNVYEALRVKLQAVSEVGLNLDESILAPSGHNKTYIHGRLWLRDLPLEKLSQALKVFIGESAESDLMMQVKQQIVVDRSAVKALGTEADFRLDNIHRPLDSRWSRRLEAAGKLLFSPDETIRELAAIYLRNWSLPVVYKRADHENIPRALAERMLKKATFLYNPFASVLRGRHEIQPFTRYLAHYLRYMHENMKASQNLTLLTSKK